MRDRNSQIWGDVYIYSIPKNEIIRLTDDGNNLTPTWSPQNNDLIAYIKSEPQILNYSIHIMSLANNCDEFLYTIDYGGNLAWSPNGEKLAFIQSGGIYQIDLQKMVGNSIIEGEIECQLEENDS